MFSSRPFVFCAFTSCPFACEFDPFLGVCFFGVCFWEFASLVFVFLVFAYLLLFFFLRLGF